MSIKFLFNDDFEAKELEPPPISYDQNDLDIACREHFLKGFEEGRFQALQEIEASCRLILNAIQSSLDEVDRFQQQSQKTVATVIEKTIATILPHFCATAASTEVQGIVEDVLKKVIGAQEMTIMCAHDLVRVVEEKIETLKTTTKISINGDDTYHNSDVRMEWHGGFIERNEQKLCDDLTLLLTKYGREVEDAKV